MKVEKLLTLSQFIEYAKITCPTDKIGRLNIIEKYNNFLKQPRTKEMLVNPLEKPIIKYNEEHNYSVILLERWNIFDKAVIFKGYMDDQYYINNNISYNFNDMLLGIKTLHDLAEATNGKLELKNVTI